MIDDAEARLAALGITLPTPPAPAANYVPTVVSGGWLYVAGQLPNGPMGLEFAGKLGRDFSREDGQKAARLCAVNILAQAKAALGSLASVGRVVKLNGYVNGTADFDEPHLVINAASELIAQVLGDRGKHARAAVTVASLPMGAAVEIDAVIAIAEG